MNQREAFMRAIHAAPDDPHPKRVFADWLEEQGEPEMAEYIRLRCDRAAQYPEFRPEPSDRERRLLDYLGGETVVPPIDVSYEYVAPAGGGVGVAVALHVSYGTAPADPTLRRVFGTSGHDGLRTGG